jgi:hypothetical protein
MLQIEKEEDRQSLEEPDKQSYHLCIVNLVIGTLYCAKVLVFNCAGSLHYYSLFSCPILIDQY